MRLVEGIVGIPQRNFTQVSPSCFYILLYSSEHDRNAVAVVAAMAVYRNVINV
jgi:hypothetical protein